MKDFLGNQLEADDKVVCAVAHGRNAGASLVRGKVVRFTPQMVVVKCPEYYGGKAEERRIDPNKIIKLPVSLEGAESTITIK